MRLARAAAVALTAGCAFASDPPGGPPRTTPPRVVQILPESGAVLDAPPRRAEIAFDEVINEQIASAQQRDIAGAVILSPAAGKVNVDWHRTRITVEPKGGFRAGRIYRLELLPVVTDLRQNRLKRGRLVVFSTGPPIPDATLRGTVVDWAGGKAAPAALVEAVLMPDSLPYRALADSAGNFAMPVMPPGDYLVWGVVDQNGNRRRDPREAFDTLRVTLQDSASLELYAFAHDTLGPRLRAVDALDSLTLRLSFDRPLDPAQAPDTDQVHLATAADSTTYLALASVMTPAGYDSATKAAAAAAAAADSAKRAAEAARDTTRRPAAPAPPARAPAAAAPTRARPGGPPLARTDTTPAMRMLLRRPAPTDNRVVRLVAPLVPGMRYVITTDGLRGLTGLARSGRAALLAPKPAPRRTGADSARAGAAAGRGARGVGADSLRAPAAPDTTPPPRPDTLPARPDTAAPRPRPPAGR